VVPVCDSLPLADDLFHRNPRPRCRNQPDLDGLQALALGPHLFQGAEVVAFHLCPELLSHLIPRLLTLLCRQQLYCEILLPVRV